MIYEYAVAPAVVAFWADEGRHTMARTIAEGVFGVGFGRLVSMVPKANKWKQEILASFRRLREGKDEAETQKLKHALTELVQLLVSVERAIKRRGCCWDDRVSWEGNAVEEHRRWPFRGVIALRDLSCDAAFAPASMHNDNELWRVQRGPVPREPEAMAAVVAPLLKRAKHVVFVDPHFSAERDHHGLSMPAFLKATYNRPLPAPLEDVTLITSDRISEDCMRLQHARDLALMIPKGRKLSILRLKELSGEEGSPVGGEKLHNRYILTEMGGVAFGIGLDSRQRGSTLKDTEDMHLLAWDVWQKRRSQYREGSGCFGVVGDAIVVEGARRDPADG